MTTTMDRAGTSVGVTLARRWYAVVGAGALLLTAGHIWGAIGGGSRFDAPLVLGGIAIGVLALAAMAWVTAGGAWRTVVAWLGIGAGALPFAVAVWIAFTRASLDAQVLVGIPAILALAAGVRMAMARAGAGPQSAGRNQKVAR
jgi:hypothetical protein